MTAVMLATNRSKRSIDVHPKPLIQFKGVSKRFSTHSGEVVNAVNNVDLAISRGEFITVVGPSGCGKTTLLRMLAGLELASAGQLTVHGQGVSGTSPDVAVVFQSATLLPWYSVLDNVLLPIRVTERVKPKDREHAYGLLEAVGLRDFAQKYPNELSGGMQQRVSICRALIRDPNILLMDEPFGALDAMTRELMNIELMRIWSSLHKTVLFITHSIPEAVLLGDRVVVMTPRPGRIAEIIDVDLDRPRSLSAMGSPRFGELCDHIRSTLGSDKQSNSNF